MKLLFEKYFKTRRFTEKICFPLEIEDYVIQSMSEVSPPKWHLAHTTWFFEKLILERYLPNYCPFNNLYYFMFNSYYRLIGPFLDKSLRSNLSRPTVEEVYQYRKNIDSKMSSLFESIASSQESEFKNLVQIGINHEQQHQELLLTDIKHIFWSNPLRPSYQKNKRLYITDYINKMEFIEFCGGLKSIGSNGLNKQEFVFDNEKPKHSVMIYPYKIASRLVINKEYIEFIEDYGYSRPELWLSQGWDCKEKNSWKFPLYWEKADGKWFQMTLEGMRELVLEEPVCHVSYFEADAFTKWKGLRLPTEAEWENSAENKNIDGNFLESGYLHPCPSIDGGNQFFGDVWEWTSSSYQPYPGFKSFPNELAEYNSKFMCNQFVLKGGSCLTASDHIRRTYRNFFPPETRWQFSGIRLAASIERANYV